MRLISCSIFALAITIASISWKYVEPVITQNGTSVIYAMTNDGKNGGKPATVKIPDNLTEKQHELLNFAYIVAKEDGYKHPQYLQGVIMQESLAGGLKEFRVAGLTNKPGDRYFGISQIKLAAAKDVMKQYPVLWVKFNTKTDEELQARLILDDQLNIRIASKYLLMAGVNDNPTKAITAYNQGATGALLVDPTTHDYTVKVKGHLQRMKNVQEKTVGIRSSLQLTQR